MTPSVGIALSEATEEQPEEVLRQVYLAMYAAKSRDKVQSSLRPEHRHPGATEHLRLANELRRTVERKELEVTISPLSSWTPAGSTT